MSDVLHVFWRRAIVTCRQVESFIDIVGIVADEILYGVESMADVHDAFLFREQDLLWVVGDLREVPTEGLKWGSKKRQQRSGWKITSFNSQDQKYVYASRGGTEVGIENLFCSAKLGSEIEIISRSIYWDIYWD